MHVHSQVPSVLHQLIMRYGLQQVQQLRYIPHPQCEAEVRVGQHVVERLVHVVLMRGGVDRSEGSGLAAASGWYWYSRLCTGTPQDRFGRWGGEHALQWPRHVSEFS